MRLLVLATDYPRLDGSISNKFVHTRNCWYKKFGIDVSVISFAARNDYVIDGINVYTETTYNKELVNTKYDLLVSHAPNIRGHYRFIIKHGHAFSAFVFFFHGHEVLRTSKVYPKPYSFVRKSIISRAARELYDSFKLFFWRHFFQKYSYKSQFIFVSQWMFNAFLHHVKIDQKFLENKSHIVYNSIGADFEEKSYQPDSEKRYDFITIRSNIDGSKYGIDIVNKLAWKNPQHSFCVIGKGNYFYHFEKPNNLEWINNQLNHEEIIYFLNASRCALLPTRADSQGVMACEMATFGIPLITSDIDVCKEVFSEFDNVSFINNSTLDVDLTSLLNEMLKKAKSKVINKYYSENTICKEVEIYLKLAKGISHG